MLLNMTYPAFFRVLPKYGCSKVKIWSKRPFVINSHFCASAASSPATFSRKGGDYEGVIVGELNCKYNRNAFSYSMIRTLNEAFENIASDHSARVLILKSGLTGVFCAGADLKERKMMPDKDVPHFVTNLRALMTTLANLPIPSIAVIDGVAFGGGLEMALACDMRIGSPLSLLGLVETRLGIIPGAGGTQRLSRVVGLAKAKEMIFTGAKIDADEAKRIGLLNHVSDDPLAKTLELSTEILKAGPIAIRVAKVVIDKGFEVDVNSGMAFEQQGYAQVVNTKDRQEGMKAFVEKREPQYVGE